MIPFIPTDYVINPFNMIADAINEKNTAIRQAKNKVNDTVTPSPSVIFA